MCDCSVIGFAKFLKAFILKMRKKVRKDNKKGLLMRKLSAGVFFLICLSASTYAMEKKMLYTPQTMLGAIKKGDREVLILHQKNYVPLKAYILLALWNTKETYIRDAFFKNPITLSLEVFNEFLETQSENIELKKQEEFSDFVHRLIGVTGIIPTVQLCNELPLYKNKFVQWYLNEVKTGALTPKEIKKL